MLCDGLIPRNCIFKENHYCTFRKVLPFYLLNTPPKFKGTGSYTLEGINFPGFGKMQLHLTSAHSPKMKVTRRNHLIRRGSKTMKNGNMFSNELRTAKIRDLHLHPTPWHVLCWGTTLTESAVHSLVHPCCASVKSGSNPTELRRFIQANCVGGERRSRAPWHRDELRDDWEPQGNSSIDVYKTWQTWQQMATICFWEPQLLAFWCILNEVFVSPSTHNLERTFEPPKLNKTSRKVARATTVGTRLVPVFATMNESSHADSEMDRGPFTVIPQ